MAKDDGSKGSGALGAIMFLVMFFVAIDAAAFAAVYFNIANIRPKVIDYLNERNGARTEEIVQIQRLTEQLNDSNSKIAELEVKNTELQGALTRYDQDELIRQADRQRESEETKALNAKLTTQIEELGELVKIYEKMEAKNAADIMVQLKDNELVTRILKNMKTDKQASILSQMSPEQAALYTRSMVSGQIQ